MKSIFDITKTVCFTGPRPYHLIPSFTHLNPYSKGALPFYHSIIINLQKEIQNLISQGYTNFISGGAQGFDQLAFWAVHNLKRTNPTINNIVYKPFNGQENQWQQNGLFSQFEYNDMLSKADFVYTCTENIIPTDYNSISTALLYRNKQMVNSSTIIIAYTKDSSWENSTTKGGTASCLRYAKEMNKTIIQFYQSFF